MTAETYYKAVRPDGTDFFTGTVQWVPKGGIPEGGWLVKHPFATRTGNGGASCYLSVATVPTDCTGMKWPCRLLRVERTRNAVWSPDPGYLPNKRASVSWRVVEELPARLALGPQGEEVAALIARAGVLTTGEARRLGAPCGVPCGAPCDAAWGAAWDAARDAAWGAAWDAARDAARAAARDAARDAAWDAAWDAARDAAWDAARDAVLATLTRDLITPEQYDLLMAPWLSVIGEVR